MADFNSKRSVLKFFALALSVLFLILLIKKYKLKPIATGIIELEAKQKPLVMLKTDHIVYLMRSQSAMMDFQEEMSRCGWQFVQNYGNGYVFTNGEDEILMKKRVLPMGYISFSLCGETELESNFRAS